MNAIPVRDNRASNTWRFSVDQPIDFGIISQQIRRPEVEVCVWCNFFLHPQRKLYKILQRISKKNSFTFSMPSNIICTPPVHGTEKGEWENCEIVQCRISKCTRDNACNLYQFLANLRCIFLSYEVVSFFFCARYYFKKVVLSVFYRGLTSRTRWAR